MIIDTEIDQLLAEIDSESVSGPREQLLPQEGNERRAVLRYLARSVRGLQRGDAERENVLDLINDLRHGEHTRRQS